MDEITRSEGRTILFVSHNMTAIQQLCKKTVVLEGGEIKFIGNTEDSINFYTKGISERLDGDDLSNRSRSRRSAMNVVFDKIEFYDNQNSKIKRAISGQPLSIGMSYKSKSKEFLENCRISLAFKTIYGEQLFICSTDLTNTEVINLQKEGEIRCQIDKLPLNTGKYVHTAFIEVDKQIEDWIEDAVVLEVDNGDFYGTGTTSTYLEGRGVLVDHKWITQ
jgi:lipopolysaccharide transport system ATP-binding protein